MTTNNIERLHKISSIQPLAEQGETCCASTACNSNDLHNDIEQTTQNDFNDSNNAQIESWKVFGMDCPSCAKKIEKAVEKIHGVDKVQVLFATEKLLVNFTQPATTQQIELACQNAGFTLNNLSSPISESTNNKPANIVNDNLQIISITVAMFIGALAKIWSPEISQWIFTLTCLVGLYPIGKKAIQLAKSGTPFAIETLMSVAALGALYLGETAEAAMVLLLFLIGERLEAFAASRARSGVQSLMELVPENATKIVNDERAYCGCGITPTG